MSEEKKNEQQSTQALEAKFEDKDGYIKYKHEVNGKPVIMYIEEGMHPLAAFEAAFDYASHFKSSYYSQKKKLEEAKAEEAKKEEGSDKE